MIDSDTYIPAIIIDLDGTLLNGNSFTRFTVWLMKKSLRRVRPDAIFPLLWNVALRKARLRSHAETKRGVMRAAERILKEKDYEDFIRSISTMLRPEVTFLISQARKRSLPICLATAAPKEYSVVLARLLGMDAAVATPLPPKGEKMKECRGDVKRQMVEELCHLRGWQPAVTLTDHHDDIPLMLWTASCGGRNVLIEPSEATRDKVSKAGIPTLSLKTPMDSTDVHGSPKG